MARLEKSLGALPPPQMRDLPEEQLDELADHLDRIVARHSAELDAAIRASLKYLPPGTRGVAKRMLGL